MKLSPYIYFAGNAEEALNFYANALDGSVQQLGRYGDSPMESSGEWKQKILHARLSFGDNLIMISDTFEGQPAPAGGSIQLSLQIKTVEELEAVFNKMAEGGTVTMQTQDTFWGARFGMLKDKFGISWMFNCELKKL